MDVDIRAVSKIKIEAAFFMADYQFLKEGGNL